MRSGRTLSVICFALAFAVTAGLAAAQTTIDYTGYSPGDNIEGALLGNVRITSDAGDVNYIVALDEAHKAYGAPNVPGFPANGCLPDEGGFSDLTLVNNTSNTSHQYAFSFEEDGSPATVNSFQITMYDFGDFNPVHRTTHQVAVDAFDADGNQLGSDTLMLFTTSATNPRQGSYSGPGINDFDPYYAADACTAGDGEPGRYTFSVASEGIASIVLTVVTDSDPKIGFGAVEFTLEEPDCDPVPYDLCAGQTSDIGEVVVTNDDVNLSVTFNIAEPGWYLEETHVAVGNEPGDIPQTKKGNPIPGQFPYFCEALEPMQQTCTVTIPLDGWCNGNDIVVAAHAAVVEVAGDGCDTEIFWASEVIDSHQGLRKDGNAVLTERSNPASALGAPDSPQPDINFFSLGFGGWVTLGFGSPIYNGPGDDIVTEEVTWGGYPLESADVFGMQDGMPYFAGEVTNNYGTDGTDYADLPAPKTVFDSVTFVDTTDPSVHGNNADGYDLDAVGACYLLLGEETAWGDGCDGTRFTEKGNWGTYFYYTINECAECD